MSNKPCSIGHECWRYDSDFKAACKQCANPNTDVPITDLRGPQWMSWDALTYAFDRAGVHSSNAFPGVRRYYLHSYQGFYFKPDVLALIQKLQAQAVEDALGDAQDR